MIAGPCGILMWLCLCRGQYCLAVLRHGARQRQGGLEVLRPVGRVGVVSDVSQSN